MTVFIQLIGGFKIILCECGELVDGCTFKNYIKTSANPSTATIGHINCGLIFNFIDGKMPKRYSSKIKLKTIAVKFAEKKKFDSITMAKFLLEVDRLKSLGSLSDIEILIEANKKIIK